MTDRDDSPGGGALRTEPHRRTRSLVTDDIDLSGIRDVPGVELVGVFELSPCENG